MLKKIIFWAVVIFVGFYLLTNPHGAAALVTFPLHMLKDAANSLAGFVNSL